MRSLGWALARHDWSPCEKRRLGHRHIHNRPCEETKGEDGRLQTKEKGLEQILS